MLFITFALAASSKLCSNYNFVTVHYNYFGHNIIVYVMYDKGLIASTSSSIVFQSHLLFFFLVETRAPKLVLNILKVMKNSTSIYTPWVPSSNFFFKKFPIYMWPVFTHVCPCASMCEL
jgi:hypothetical protein